MIFVPHSYLNDVCSEAIGVDNVPNTQTVMTQALSATKDICLRTGYIEVLISTYRSKSSKLSG